VFSTDEAHRSVYSKDRCLPGGPWHPAASAAATAAEASASAATSGAATPAASATILICTLQFSESGSTNAAEERYCS
jgi:hypothetical protein